MQPARELPQLFESLVELLRRALQDLLDRGRWLGLQLRARQPQGQRERDEALLCAVVQVTLELAPLFVARLDDACARRLQVLTRLGSGDSERRKLAEGHQPRLAVARQCRARRNRNGA